MAVRRDYGSFVKASKRLLAPQIESLGYRIGQRGEFVREKSGWVEGFFLQQSQWGSGDFFVNIGINVPALYEYWSLDHSDRDFGLLIAWRLSDSGREDGVDSRYQAKNKEQLENSIGLVAIALTKADSWFHQFHSVSDVVESYRVREGLPNIPSAELNSLRILNYGLLLLIDDSRDEAARWLHCAKTLESHPKYWNPKSRTFTRERLPGAKLMKPTEDDKLRVRVIDSALATIES